jgi:hypothetical protein
MKVIIRIAVGMKARMVIKLAVTRDSSSESRMPNAVMPSDGGW